MLAVSATAIGSWRRKVVCLAPPPVQRGRLSLDGVAGGD